MTPTSRTTIVPHVDGRSLPCRDVHRTNTDWWQEQNLQQLLADVGGW